MYFNSNIDAFYGYDANEKLLIYHKLKNLSGKMNFIHLDTSNNKETITMLIDIFLKLF